MEMSLLSCPVCLKPHFQGVDALRSSLINVATTHISCPVCSELLLGLDKLTIHLFSHISSSRVPQDCSLKANDETDTQKSKSRETSEKQLNKDTLEETHDTQMLHKSELNLPTIEKENPSVNAEKNISCDICNFHFSDETILDLHQKLLHQTSPDKETGQYNYHCHLCSKQFRMRGSLMIHLRVAHFGFVQNSNRNALNSCGDKLETHDSNAYSGNLRLSHISEDILDNRQKVINERKVFCVPLQHSFLPTEKGNKASNINVKGQDNKQWECEVCLKFFTTKYFLKKHKRLHTGEMPYYCSQCNKYFTFQQSYHKHMLYHSDDKPHICSECGRAFKELSTLHNHERIHSGERPFSCENCGKCFRQRVSYLVHRRIHTGAMPYKCTACNKSFRYKVSQRSHKCPVSPPGCVVRTPDLVEKLIQNHDGNPNLPNQKVPTQNLFKLNHNAAVASLKCCTNSKGLNCVNLNTDVKDAVGTDATIENFHFLENNLRIITQGKQNNVIQNRIPENPIMNETHCEPNEHTSEILDGSAVDTCKTPVQENAQEFHNYECGSTENQKNDIPVNFTSPDIVNPDFFALILSPVLSDVQSLCLSSYTSTQNDARKGNTSTNEDMDTLQTINEESFKELLYGSSLK